MQSPANSKFVSTGRTGLSACNPRPDLQVAVSTAKSFLGRFCSATPTATRPVGYRFNPWSKSN